MLLLEMKERQVNSSHMARNPKRKPLSSPLLEGLPSPRKKLREIPQGLGSITKTDLGEKWLFMPVLRQFLLSPQAPHLSALI